VNRGRCQICGRKLRVRTTGGLVSHHKAARPCAGAGSPPLELSDAFLASRIDTLKAAALELVRERKALEARRVNWIDPSLSARSSAALSEAFRLERRLKRWRELPLRRARQMEQYGYWLE
jgi:hypothetical protein